MNKYSPAISRFLMQLIRVLIFPILPAIYALVSYLLDPHIIDNIWGGLVFEAFIYGSLYAVIIALVLFGIYLLVYKKFQSKIKWLIEILIGLVALVLMAAFS